MQAPGLEHRRPQAEREPARMAGRGARWRDRWSGTRRGCRVRKAVPQPAACLLAPGADRERRRERFATSAKRSAVAKLWAGPTTSAPAVSRVWRMSMAMKGSSSTTRIGTPSSFMASSRPDRPSLWHALVPPQGSWLAPPIADMRRQYSGTPTSLAAAVRSKPAIAFLPRDPANSARPCRGDGPLPVCGPHPPPCPRQRNAMGSVRFLTVQPKAVKA